MQTHQFGRFLPLRCRLFTVGALALLFGHSGAAATLHVPKDHKTIQAAIDMAAPGDTILVAAGTYRETLKLKERVTLKSAGDDTPAKRGLQRAEATVIEHTGANAKGPAVLMAEGSVLDGFSVTRAGAFDQKDYDFHYATSGELLPDERGAVGVKDAVPALGVPGVTRHHEEMVAFARERGGNPDDPHRRDPLDFAVRMSDPIAPALFAFQIPRRKRPQGCLASVGQHQVELQHVVDRLAMPDRPRAGRAAPPQRRNSCASCPYAPG